MVPRKVWYYLQNLKKRQRRKWMRLNFQIKKNFSVFRKLNLHFSPWIVLNHNLSRCWVTFLTVTTMKLTILLHLTEYQRSTERATSLWLGNKEQKRNNSWKAKATLHGSCRSLSETPEMGLREAKGQSPSPFRDTVDGAVSKMLSAYFQSPLCPFPENISNGV